MGMAANKYVPRKDGVSLPLTVADDPSSALEYPLRAGDVTWCAFPFHTAPGRPGDYPRPCLVLETRSIDGTAYHLVAYGTSKKLESAQRWPGDVVFSESDGEHFLALGVSGPGKFRLCQTALLPAVPAYFPCPPFRFAAPSGRRVEGSRLGRLTPQMVEVVKHTSGQLAQFRRQSKGKALLPDQPKGPACTQHRSAAASRPHP
jgi:hypothetical protein